MQGKVHVSSNGSSSSSRSNSTIIRDECGGSSSSSGVVMRKGPWMAEEDEILLDYVEKHGPRDWSSIRSKGLLPRTGKSCRLRWVNKLKPDLKSGCKFSPEEERIVIELQGRFGNKWARIATYLTGRTDNDVKNFWSTRQKRLARLLLQTPMPSKSNKNQGRLPLPNNHGPPTFEVASLDLLPTPEDYSSSGQCSQMPILENQGLFNMYSTLPLLEPTMDQEQTQLHFDHLPDPELDFPFLQGPDHHLPSYADMDFPDELVCPETLPFFSLQEVGKHEVKREEHLQAPDCLFDEFQAEFPTEFPTDIFDHLEPPPSTSASW